MASRLRSPSPGSIFAVISVMATIAPSASRPSSTHGRRVRSTKAIGHHGTARRRRRHPPPGVDVAYVGRRTLAAMRRISDRERRARLAVRHHLAPSAKATDVIALAGQMVGLHSTDPATVFLGAAARLQTPTVEGIKRALYDDRALVRTLCMRRTLFVIPIELVPIVQAAVTDALVRPERKRTVRMIERPASRKTGRG